MQRLTRSSLRRLVALSALLLISAPMRAALADPFPTASSPGNAWTALAPVAGATNVVTSPWFATDGLVFVGAPGGVYRYSSLTSSLSTAVPLDGTAVSDLKIANTGVPLAPAFLVLAVTRAGNVWVSSTGTSYSRLNLGGVAQQFGAHALSVVASPQYRTDHILFVGTDKAGILESKDAGATFLPSNLGLLPGLGLSSLFSPVVQMAISPNFDDARYADNTVFAGTRDRGIFRSSGTTILQWSQVLGPPSPIALNQSSPTSVDSAMPPVLSIAVSPNFQALGYTGHAQVAAALDQATAGAVPGGIWTSTDGGLTWADIAGSVNPAGWLNRPSQFLAYSPMFGGTTTGDQAIYSIQPRWTHPTPPPNTLMSAVTDLTAVYRNGQAATNPFDPNVAWCALPADPNGCQGSTAGFHSASVVYSDPRALAVATVGDTALDGFSSHSTPADPNFQTNANGGYVNYVFLADAVSGLEVFRDDSPTMLNNFAPNYAQSPQRPAVDIWGYNFVATGTTPSVTITRIDPLTGATTSTAAYPPGPQIYFQTNEVAGICGSVLFKVTAAYVTPSHIIMQVPDYSSAGTSCTGFLMVVNPNSLYDFDGNPFTIMGPRPLTFGISHPGSLWTGGDHILLPTFDYTSSTYVRFTKTGDTAAQSLPCDWVRVFCTLSGGITKPSNYASNPHLDVVTPGVNSPGLYDITVNTDGVNGNVLEGTMLFAQYRYVDTFATPAGQARGMVFVDPEPRVSNPNFGYEVDVLPAGWNPLYPCEDDSSLTPMPVYAMNSSSVPGVIVSSDTHPNGVTVSGVFRTDGGGVFAALVQLAKGPVDHLPSALNPVRARPVVLHNSGAGQTIPTVAIKGTC